MTKAAHYPGKPAPAPARARRAVVVALIASMAVAACGGPTETVRRAPPPQREWAVVAPADPAAANAVVIRAISLVGTPYRYGGNTPDGGFDCSGLVNYVFRDMLDLGLPRTSRALADYAAGDRAGGRIDPERLAAADLVFFGSRGNVTHVGIYVGQGRFVHAPSSGGTVRLDHLDGAYWRDHYAGARRVLR